MLAIAHEGCADTFRESAPEVDSAGKIPCRTGDSNPRQVLRLAFQWNALPAELSQLPHTRTHRYTQTRTHAYTQEAQAFMDTLTVLAGSPQVLLDKISESNQLLSSPRFESS